jgi:hypothetical protein
MDECDENLGNGLGDSSGDAVSGDAVSGDAGDEVWRGLATEGVDNNKLGGNNVGVCVGVVMLGAIFIKICIRCIYI